MEFSERPPVLVDDGSGRRMAAALGLDIVGSAGVLIQAKKYGLIPEVRPILEELRDAGLYLGGPAISRILQAAGES
jgi:predicted nucleic acid-binding protein